MDPEQNPNLEKGDIIWGTNEIMIKKEGQDSGYCEWQPAEEDEKFEVPWKRITLEILHEDRKRPMSIQPIKDRKFRYQIMALDEEKCVISGERTREALDAAHIKSVADNGSEMPQNGIALRADIHRLYDAGKFFINPTSGKPDRSSSDLSKEYKEILKKAKLPNHILDRVRDALREVWPGDQ